MVRCYGFGVILNYLFRVDKLMEIVKANLPMHIVEEGSAALDESGQLQKQRSRMPTNLTIFWI